MEKMRAKTVNENVSFERDQDPKEAMGIGGFTLNDEYKKIEEAKRRYRDFVQKNIVGKTIFVGEALSVYFMRDVNITDVRFEVNELSNIDVDGEIRLRGNLLSVNEEDLITLEKEQWIESLPTDLEIRIAKDERIRILN